MADNMTSQNIDLYSWDILCYGITRRGCLTYKNGDMISAQIEGTKSPISILDIYWNAIGQSWIPDCLLIFTAPKFIE
jgi:hypothetical protein